MRHYKEVYSEDTQGFHITLSIRPEDTDPRDVYDWNQSELDDLCDKIDRGLLVWFVARVDAYRYGVLLASEYLGECMYDSINEFIVEDYYADMVDSVVSEAKKIMARLQCEH
jgi:hypothetical protein